MTYQRTEYALRTVRALLEAYPAIPWLWYVADDGSEGGHYEAVLAEIARLGGVLCGSHSERLSYGGNANVIMRTLYQFTDVALWLEDDWEIYQPVDWPSHLALLRDPLANIGMVRLGLLPIGLAGETFGHTGQVYWRMDKGRPYAFSGNPSLRTIQFCSAYGDYPVGLRPGDTECTYDAQVRAQAGPDIAYPAYLGMWGAFRHIGAVKSY